MKSHQQVTSLQAQLNEMLSHYLARTSGFSKLFHSSGRTYAIASLERINKLHPQDEKAAYLEAEKILVAGTPTLKNSVIHLLTKPKTNSVFNQSMHHADEKPRVLLDENEVIITAARLASDLLLNSGDATDDTIIGAQRVMAERKHGELLSALIRVATKRDITEEQHDLVRQYGRGVGVNLFNSNHAIAYLGSDEKVTAQLDNAKSNMLIQIINASNQSRFSLSF